MYAAVALALQALYAVPHARDAFLSFPLPEHIHALDGYWAGAEATRAPGPTAIPPRDSAAVHLVQRIQTLFVFMQHSSRAAVVLGDIVPVLPRAMVLQMSRGAEMHVVLELFLETLVQAYLDAGHLAADQVVSTSRTATVAARSAYALRARRLFQSYAAAACDTAPASATAAVPGEAQPTATITLTHTATDTDVSSCLFSKLMASADMHSLLITHAADVLLLPVQHTPGVQTRFTLEETVYLDPFVWDTHNGQRIDTDPRWRQLQDAQAEWTALASRRAQLQAPRGDALRPLLASCERVGVAGDAYAGVATWLGHVATALDADEHALDARLAALDDSMQAMRTALVAERPACRAGQYAYTLRALLLASTAGDCTYVQEGDQWFHVEAGHASPVRFADVCADKRGADEGHGVALLAYARTDAAPCDPARLYAAAEHTVQAVATDNAHLA